MKNKPLPSARVLWLGCLVAVGWLLAAWKLLELIIIFGRWIKHLISG